jgi:hypothetical protein
VRLTLCGSAITVMSEPLSGTKAMRGGGARRWSCASSLPAPRRPCVLENRQHDAAFINNALIGGTPGYRDLVPDPSVPDCPARRMAGAKRPSPVPWPCSVRRTGSCPVATVRSGVLADARVQLAAPSLSATPLASATRIQHRAVASRH